MSRSSVPKVEGICFCGFLYRPRLEWKFIDYFKMNISKFQTSTVLSFDEPKTVETLSGRLRVNHQKEALLTFEYTAQKLQSHFKNEREKQIVCYFQHSMQQLNLSSPK